MKKIKELFTRKRIIPLIIILVMLSVWSYSSPELAQTSYDLSMYYYNIGSYDLCIEEINTIIGNGDVDTVRDLLQYSQYLLGMCYLKLDQYENAKAYFNAIVSNPYARVLIDESYLRLILADILNEDYLNALSLVDQYRNRTVGKYVGNAMMLKAEALIILGRKEEAQNLLLAIIEDQIISDSYFDAIIRLKQLLALGEPQAVPQEVIVYQPVDRNDPHEVATEYRQISEEEFNQYLAWQQQLRDWENRLKAKEEALVAWEQVLNNKEQLLNYQTQVLQDIDTRLQERIEWLNQNLNSSPTIPTAPLMTPAPLSTAIPRPTTIPSIAPTPVPSRPSSSPTATLAPRTTATPTPVPRTTPTPTRTTR